MSETQARTHCRMDVRARAHTHTDTRKHTHAHARAHRERERKRERLREIRCHIRKEFGCLRPVNHGGYIRAVVSQQESAYKYYEVENKMTVMFLS